jgi:hypothetical protein
MKNRKSDLLKSLIKKTELDKPPLSFTILVMQEIEASAKEEPVTNPELRLLMKRHTMETPSVAFTNEIMAKIQNHDFKIPGEPILSKKGWNILVAAVVIIFTSLVFFEGTSTSADGLTPYLITIGQILNIIFRKVNAISPLYLITLISFGSLFVLDYFLRKSNLLKKI